MPLDAWAAGVDEVEWWFGNGAQAAAAAEQLSGRTR